MADDRDRLDAYTRRLDFYLGAQSPTYGRRRRDEVRLVANYTRVLTELHATATLGQLTITHAGQPIDGLDPIRLLTWLRAAIVLGDAPAYADRSGDWRILSPAHLFYTNTGIQIRHTPHYWETWTPHTLTITHDAKHDTPQDIHPNPYGLIPCVHLRGWPSADPTDPYGHSLIDDLAPIARSLNERLSQWLWLMRTQASPPIVTRGLDKATLRVEPGEIWPLPAQADANILKLLDTGTASTHMQTIALLQRTLRDLAGIPDIALGIGNVSLSGEAIRRAYYPLISAVNTRRAILTPALRALATAILTIRAINAGQPSPDPAHITITYANDIWD
jgi:hypothetical protein